MSALCGLSTSLGMLVCFRILQGAAGGPLMALSQTLLLSSYPEERAPAAMAIWGASSSIGPICGPVLGGFICNNWTWPWIFLINVPIVIVAAVAAKRLFLKRDPAPQYRPIDWTGLGLMILWIGALQIVLDRGLDLDWFQSNFIVVLSVVAVIGFAAFLIWELTEPNPIVNLHVFSSAGFTAGLVAIFFLFGTNYGSIILSPLWLQTNMGYTPLWAGLVSMPTGIVISIVAPCMVWVMNRVDLRLPMSAGMMLMAGVCFWRGHFDSTVTFELILANNAAFGLALVVFFIPAMTYSMASVRPPEIAAAAGILAFTRTIAIALTAALITTEWQTATVDSRAGIVDRISASAITQMSAAGVPPNQSLWHLDEMVQSQAVMLATNDTYLTIAGILVVIALGIWFAPQARSYRSVR
jgi:DHA2 family multidrug resistance protein